MPNGKTLGASRQSELNPFAPKPPEVCSSAPESRLGEAWPIAIPEQVVGSQHQFEFPAPQNLSALGAIGVISMEGSADLKAAWRVPTAVPGMGTGPLRITYAPTSVGKTHSTLTLVMKWDDGHVERRTIQVTAHARGLNEVPEAEAAARPKDRDPPKPPAGKPAPDRGATWDGLQYFSNVRDAHVRLMDEQRDGIHLVSVESQKFKPKPAERSVWADIAELAFQLGTGAIGGMVARFVASRVSQALVGAEQLAKVAQEGEAAIASAETAAIAARGSPVDASLANQEVIAKKIANYANQDAAAHAKFAEGELSALTSAAVSNVLSTAANVIRGPTASDSFGSGAPPASADAELAFFSDQIAMSRQWQRTAGVGLNSVLAEQGKRYPHLARDMMSGIAQGFDDAVHAQAKEKQATITSAQFMTYLARTSLGAEKVDTPQGSATVTDMSKQRMSGRSKLDAADLAAGVLDIACNYERGGDVRIIDARAVQVSYLVVNRLLDQHLAHSGIPIRVVLFGGTTIITRDEAGRVRVSGSLGDGPFIGEAQQIQEAERIFEIVLSKTLKDWGVPQIHTNDATQGPDPKKKASVKV